MSLSKTILPTLFILGTHFISSSVSAVETDTRQLLRGSASDPVEVELDMPEEHRELAFASNCQFYRIGLCLDARFRRYPTIRTGIYPAADVVQTCQGHCQSVQFCRGYNILNDNECRILIDADAYNFNRNGEIDDLVSLFPKMQTFSFSSCVRIHFVAFSVVQYWRNVFLVNIHRGSQHF